MRAASGVDAFEPRVAALLTDTRHELWMSTVSAWELAMLAERGGLELRPDPEQWIAAAVAGLGLHEAPVTSAIALESAWEAYENTDTVIQRYRAVTISLGYYGDSQLNSVCDIAACAIGFLLAWRLPRRVTLAWVVAVIIAGLNGWLLYQTIV